MGGVHWKEQGTLAAGDQDAVKTRLFGNGGFKKMSSLIGYLFEYCLLPAMVMECNSICRTC